MNRLVAALVLAGSVIGISSHAAAQSVFDGPTVTLERAEEQPGERLAMTISGFTSRVVDITVCGNEARRGSADCDNRATRTRETNADRTPVTAEVLVTAPPAACPCIVRVASRDNGEIAVAPLVVVGHPVAEVEGAVGSPIPLAVDVRAELTNSGDVRRALGGPSTYRLQVQVRNESTFTIDNVALSATLSRGFPGDVRSIEIADPGSLAAGEAWDEVVEVRVPSVTFGTIEWTATASGQGPAVSATDATSAQPWLLMLVAVLLALDLIALLVRFVNRTRRRVATVELDEATFGGPADQAVVRPSMTAMHRPEGDESATHRSDQLVG